MPFIGNQPALSYTSFAKQDFTTSATTSYTLDYPVANENEIALFINFVRQEPTTAYTASGTSLTLTSATSASDDMYAVFIGKAVQTINPPAGSVGTSQLASTAVTPAKLNLNDNLLFNTADKGIYLGVTSATASNLLDDYEEGTFTPGIEGTTTAGTFTPNASYTRGRYTKVGRLVQIYFGLVYSSFTGTGTMRLTGLPFASENAYMELPTSIINVVNINKPTDTYIYGTLYQNATKIGLFTQSTVSVTRAGLAIDSSGELYFTINYHTA